MSNMGGSAARRKPLEFAFSDISVCLGPLVVDPVQLDNYWVPAAE